MELAHSPHSDTYVVHFDFSDIDAEQAIAEFGELCHDLEQVGLHVEARPGDDQSLLVFARAPKSLLCRAVYNARLLDYFCGIVNTPPDVCRLAVGVDGEFEGEDLLSVYHLVTWSKQDGGAAITPGFGRWKNVKSLFPIHNEAANTALLAHLSKRIFLSYDDLDRIRNLFGVKVAFYFAYMQNYLLFLSFPAATGIYAFWFLPKYSLVYAIVTLVGCTVFLEHWKIQQADLDIRWNVRDVRYARATRAKFLYERIVVDDAGRTKHYYPKWKSISRQLLQIPFFIGALAVLGVLITMVFAIEVLISEVYEGGYKYYLEYLPTVLLGVAMPYMNSFLETLAEMLVEVENHRTQDNYEMSLSQKMFVLSFISHYLPVFLTAFVYVPLGNVVVPFLGAFLNKVFGERIGLNLGQNTFRRDPDRLRNELIALTMTGQLSDMFEEMIIPYVLHQVRTWYRSWYRTYSLIRRSRTGLFPGVAPDKPEEKALLKTVRRQASLPSYNVHDDVSEMVIQFGYLALFSPVWPLVSIGFLINNWIELRSDFLKICIEHQRPDPARAEGIGPWIDSLDTLTLLGSICTGAIVHLFGASSHESGSTLFGLISVNLSWWSLPVTIFVSEHIFLSLRSVVRFLLQRIGSNLLRRERNERFRRRKDQWSLLVAQAESAQGKAGTDGDDDGSPSTSAELADQLASGRSGLEGADMIRALKEVSSGLTMFKRD